MYNLGVVLPACPAKWVGQMVGHVIAVAKVLKCVTSGVCMMLGSCCECCLECGQLWSTSDGVEKDDRLPFHNALVDLVGVALFDDGAMNVEHTLVIRNDIS